MEAFYQRDGEEFRGRKLFVCFANSSIVSEEMYRQHRANNRFDVTVNFRQRDGQRLSSDSFSDRHVPILKCGALFQILCGSLVLKAIVL